MSEQEINEAIAEACGRERNPDGGWYPDNGLRAGTQAIPDYCSDLNAMHEAEKVLTDDQFKWYTYWVEKLMPETKYRCYLCATARHRAEAFVRSMGKWATDKDSLTVQPVTEDSSVAGKEVQP
jgi:hypothetical protein